MPLLIVDYIVYYLCYVLPDVFPSLCSSVDRIESYLIVDQGSKLQYFLKFKDDIDVSTLH